MTNHILYICSNLQFAPRFALTHYVYDIRPQITNTPMPHTGAHTTVPVRKNKKINLPQGRNVAPNCTDKTPCITVNANGTESKKRMPHNRVNKERLSEYFDNSAAADKIAAQAWVKDVVDQLNQTDAAKRHAEEELRKQIARDAELKQRAVLFTDIYEKNKRIAEITDQFMAHQNQMTKSFLTGLKRTKTK